MYWHRGVRATSRVYYTAVWKGQRRKQNEKICINYNYDFTYGGGDMTRREITKLLSELTEKLINPHNDTRIYWAKEVTFDYSTAHAVRVDYMKFKPVNNTVSGIEKGDFYCYEIKSSIEDFHSKNGHNFIGDFNYYVMPEDVYEAVKSEIPYYVGVYSPIANWWDFTLIKKAKRKNRTRSVSEMLLMMFRSAARDRKRQEAANDD